MISVFLTATVSSVAESRCVNKVMLFRKNGSAFVCKCINSVKVASATTTTTTITIAAKQLKMKLIELQNVCEQ